MLFAVVPQSQAVNSLSEQYFPKLKWRQRQVDNRHAQVLVILDSRKLISEKIPYNTFRAGSEVFKSGRGFSGDSESLG